jgi:hypothetical protein
MAVDALYQNRIDLLRALGWDDTRIMPRVGKTRKTRERPFDPFPDIDQRREDRKTLNRGTANRCRTCSAGETKHYWSSLDKLQAAEKAYREVWEASCAAEDWAPEHAAKFVASIARNDAMEHTPTRAKTPASVHGLH